MSDIVERLRRRARHDEAADGVPMTVVLLAAADEIERLRAENADLKLAVRQALDARDARDALQYGDGG